MGDGQARRIGEGWLLMTRSVGNQLSRRLLAWDEGSSFT